ncbi:hypothetical protein [Paenibacillus sp. MMS18-CY102]|uniref:hypothetical protein n=1 Tax=Paenibacillus sp. MMS18-CY102 TaxID=2682849 RepID=UPI0013653342|nr:hypothetical protein [Paenibacillus sp. MMS18-CY102]MWC27534.1 hypothetical protein [Paenibacillus sp. MMS18-CY102]
MKRDGWKWALAGGAIALLIVYGLDTADRGINNVYGPVGENVETPAVNSTVQRYAPVNNSEGNLASGTESSPNHATGNGSQQQAQMQQPTGQSEWDGRSANGSERLPSVPYDSEEPAVNRLADGAAGVLQSVSSGGIRLFVSVFDGIMD